MMIINITIYLNVRAIYPSSYERTTHCLYDDINAGEEKVYIVLFKVLDNYTDNDGDYSQLLNKSLS